LRGGSGRGALERGNAGWGQSCCCRVSGGRLDLLLLLLLLLHSPLWRRRCSRMRRRCELRLVQNVSRDLLQQERRSQTRRQTRRLQAHGERGQYSKTKTKDAFGFNARRNLHWQMPLQPVLHLQPTLQLQQLQPLRPPHLLEWRRWHDEWDREVKAAT
jgi:hypothetical protein